MKARVFFLFLLFIAFSAKIIYSQETVEVGSQFLEQKQKVNTTQPPSLQIPTSSFTPVQEDLPATGEWQGRIVKVVPNDRFSPQFTSEGIKSLFTLRDHRIIGGGINAFFIKYPNDPSWRNLQFVEIPKNFNLEGNIFSKIIETNRSPSKIYLVGNLGLLRLDKNNTLAEVVDPFDSSGHLTNIKDIVPYGNTSAAAFKDGPYGYTNGALYFIENNNVRKWLLPRPDSSKNSDSVVALFQDVITPNNKIFYAIIHCDALGGSCPRSDTSTEYLFRIRFSGDSNVPLKVTRLAKIVDNAPFGEYIHNIQIRKISGGENKKRLYGSLGNFDSNRQLKAIADFNPQLSSLSFYASFLPSDRQASNDFRSFAVDPNNADTVWLTGGNTPSTLWRVSNFFANTDSSIVAMTPDEKKNLLANSNPQVAVFDQSGTIIGHGPSSAPSHNGLITILQTQNVFLSPTNVPPWEIQINEYALGFKIPTFSQFLTFAIRGFFVISGLLALLFLLLGALAWIVSGGNKESVDKARDKIVAALIGIIIMVAVLSVVVALEQVVFKQSICFGLSCPITLPDLLKPST
jgi:hypothetical protein